MDRRRALRLLLASGTLAPINFWGRAAGADPYPSRPVKIIVPFAPGSVMDVYARKMSDPLSQALGQPVIIENRPGASGTLGVGVGAKARPDGYTVTMGSSSSLAVSPALGVKLSYDPVRDFQPITQYSRTSLVLLAHPSLGITNAKELVTLARSRPGQLAYASSGATGISRLAAEVFQHEAGIRLLNVPYKTPVVFAVLANEVPLGFDFSINSGPHVRSNKLQALLVSGRNRITSLPDVPTILESGFPGAEIYGWGGALVPAGTPKEIVMRLHKALVGVIAKPEVKALFDQEGSEVVANSPEEFRAYIVTERDRFARIVKAAGITVEEA